MELATKHQKLTYKNKHIVVLKASASHIYEVEYNPANGVFFITNTKTKKRWELQAYEFIYNSQHWNEIVSLFPNYVHKQVWMVKDYVYHIAAKYKYLTMVQKLDKHWGV